MRHPHVLELQLGGVARRAQRVDDAAHMEARRVGLDDEAGDAGPPLCRVGAGEDEAEIRPVGPGDEHLGAVDDPVVAVAHGAGLDRAGRVGAARGLGQAEECLLLAAQHRKEEALFLVVIGLEHLGQARAAEYVVAGGIEAGPVLRHLDGEQGARHDIHVRATEFGRDVEAVEAHLRHPARKALVVLRGQAVGIGVEAVLQRHDLLADEPAHLVHDQFLLVGKGQVHKSCAFPISKMPLRPVRPG